MKKENIPLTVSQLNRRVKSWLEYEMGDVEVLGELSNLSRPSSGHIYFTLKDEHAQLRCAFFRNAFSRENAPFKDGQQVIVQGRLSLYEARGDYQLIVQQMTAAGEGELYQQFLRLKAKLAQEGLFAAARKKVLPRFPACIAVISSASSAALRDILITLSRRFPLSDIYVYPSEVQGKNAAAQLIRALQQANQEARAEVIILARGGGSIEDLCAFNDEQLAYAISRSAAPVVSGVGHETDFTIADFVADLRAATPTAAAEAVTPDKNDLLAGLERLVARLHSVMQTFFEQQQRHLSYTVARLLSPRQLILNQWQTVDYLDQRLNQSINHYMNRKRHGLQILQNRLLNQSPEISIETNRIRLNHIRQQLAAALTVQLNTARQIFAQHLATLQAVNPLATLERGYAVVTFKNHILCNSRQVQEGDTVQIRLAKGQLTCSVKESHA